MDLYNQFNQYYNLLIDEYYRDKSSTNLPNEFITELMNTVKTNVNKLCLDLDLHKNFKYFYLYVLNLFIQNLANAMINSFKHVMTNNIIEYVTDTATQKNPDKNIEDDIANEIKIFEEKLNNDMFKQMYNNLMTIKTNICYDYIAVICFIVYLETNSFDFVNALTDKIVTGETAINLEFDSNTNSIIPSYTELSINNFCIDCIDCSNCLCCYECKDCMMCNCCINCIGCSQSMYCMSSLNIVNSFYVTNSRNIYYCHKCCTCNTCYYSDHITNCKRVIYVSNTLNLSNARKSFIQPMSKYLSINNRSQEINCYQRRIFTRNDLTDTDIFNSIDENILKNNDYYQSLTINQISVFYEYTQIIDKCSKHNPSKKCKDNYNNVNDDCSLIYGCTYPSQHDIYFANDYKYAKWNDIQSKFCKYSNYINPERCNKFTRLRYNSQNKNYVEYNNHRDSIRRYKDNNSGINTDINAREKYSRMY